MKHALHAEWTKLRTSPGTSWLLLAVVVLTVALSAASAGACADGCGRDPAKVTLTGVEFGQAAVAILAVLAVGGEYATGLIHTTLAALPRRLIVLAAKAIVVSGPVLAAAALAVSGSVLAGRILGLPGLSAAGAAGWRAVVGSILYLVLVGPLSLGVAAVVRDCAAAIGIVLGLLYLFPIITAVVPDPDWYKHLQQIGPMTAGLAIQATTDLASLPIAPWAGLGVLGAWASGAVLAGGLVLRLRDA